MRQNYGVPEFETSLDYIERVCLTNSIKNNNLSLHILINVQDNFYFTNQQKKILSQIDLQLLKKEILWDYSI